MYCCAAIEDLERDGRASHFTLAQLASQGGDGESEWRLTANGP